MNENSKISKAEADDASAFFNAIDRADPPLYKTTLRAHRSLPPIGFVWLISIIAVGFLIPIIAFIGSLVLWGLLLPALLTIAALWYFLKRNYKDGQVHENIIIWHDLFTVERVNPRNANQYWQANPYWVACKLHDTNEIESYLTLTGGHREIEIGAFLTPNQRLDTRYEIEKALRLTRKI